jgi:hypothetical protein
MNGQYGMIWRDGSFQNAVQGDNEKFSSANQFTYWNLNWYLLRTTSLVKMFTEFTLVGFRVRNVKCIGLILPGMQTVGKKVRR